MRTLFRVLFVSSILIVSLFASTESIDEMLFQRILTLQEQSLDVLGLPIVAPHSPQVNAPARLPTITPSVVTQADTLTTDTMTWILENVRIATPQVFVTATSEAATATIAPASPTVVGGAVATATNEPTSLTLQATATVPASDTITTTPVVASDTPIPTPRIDVFTAATPTRVLLPAQILDGFRYRMPVNGYWYAQNDGIRFAVSSIQYASQLYSSVPASNRRFVTMTIQISNLRSSSQPAIYLDRTYMSIIDIDGNSWQSELITEELGKPFMATTVLPGQSVYGQVAFLLDENGAPGQLVIAYANNDAYLSRASTSIELRVWPTIN